jgi:hypothetical protein
MTGSELQHVLEVVFPGVTLVIVAGGVALRLSVKPLVDSMLRLKEGLKTDRDAQVRIAQLEAEVLRLRAAEAVRPVLEPGSWSKEPLRRE